MIKVGDRVKTNKMSVDSYYKQVIGKVSYIRNGFVGIEADLVCDKWSVNGEFLLREIPLSTAAKLTDVVLF